MCHCALCVSCVWYGDTVDRILHSLLINNDQIIFYTRSRYEISDDEIKRGM